MNKTEKPSVSDDAVKAKTGKSWPEWFSVLDNAGAATKNHKEIVALLKPFPEVSAWWQQMITVEYEKARGLRAKHEMTNGFQISVSKTFPFPLAALYQSLLQDPVRAKLAGLAGSSVKSKSENKVVRLNLSDKSVAEFRLIEKPGNKTQVTVQQSKLPDATHAEEKKKFWKELLNSSDWYAIF